LKKLGGAQVILSTVTNNAAMSDVLPGLKGGGKLVVLGVGMEPLALNTVQIILNRQAVAGWPSGTAADSEDTLNFSALTGIRPMNEIYPFERAAEAYERMMSGRAKFRVVLKVG
jgi:D-arabinose 1-dehydrogenase-like Zn-dependent alcohol dehydrogenase